jgi:hypothetical protein
MHDRERVVLGAVIADDDVYRETGLLGEDTIQRTGDPLR